MADKEKNQNTEIEKKKQRENTIKAENQGGVWITDQPNRNAEKNTTDEADYDKMTGNKDQETDENKE